MPDPALIGMLGPNTGDPRPRPAEPSRVPDRMPGRPTSQPAAPGGRDPLPMPLLRTTVGEVLRRVRLEQGRTLADVARAASVSMPYLSELERGRKEASSEVLAALCGALGIGLPDLIEQVGHDLAEEQARRAPVIRLDRALLSRRAPGQPTRPADAVGPGSANPVCLLAA